MFTPSRRPRSSGFAQIPNDVLRDVELSARARGVLGYLLSHSDGFEVTRATVGDAFPEGRDAIDTALRELREAGYVRAVRTQGDAGRFTGARYLVFDERGAAEAEAEDDAENHGPDIQGDGVRETTPLENRAPDNPHAHIRTPIPKNTNTKNTKENTTRARELAAGFDSFWAVYPTKVGKGAARPSFERAVRRAAGKGYRPAEPGPGIEALVIAATEYAAAVRSAGTEMKFVPNPATWLNQDRWGDVLEHSVASGGGQLTAAEQMLANIGSMYGENGGGTTHAIGR